MPFFSIVVVSFNAEKLIKETIESILEQDFTDYEVIVKDAVSKDNTLEMIPKDDKIKVYSCPDKGIYDGMNQAISYSSGKYICFMNCGDFFHSNDVLSKVYDSCKDIENNALIFGDSFTCGEVLVFPQKITKNYLYRRGLCHQAMFFSADIFEKHGLYDTDFKIVADYEKTLKSFFNGVKFIHSGVVVCDYLGGGVSAIKKNRKKLLREHKTAKRRYFSRLDRFKYGFRDFITIKPLRVWMSSETAPKWIRKLYRKLSNNVNK